MPDAVTTDPAKHNPNLVEPPGLRYFCEVARQGSLRGAAQRLFVAQSAISRQIAALEETLGVTLFERHARGMSLTAAGRMLLEFANDTRGRFEAFRARIHDFETLRQGHVDIVTVEGLLSGLMLTFTPAFLARYPGISLTVAALGSQAVAEAVAQRQAELGLVFGSSPRSDLIEVTSMRQPLCAIVSGDHPLARKDVCVLSDITPYPVVLPNRSFGIRQLIDRACAAQRLTFHPVVETNSLAFAWQLTEQSRRVTFLPVDSLRSQVNEGRLAAIPIDVPAFRRTSVTLVISASRTLSAAAQAALDELITLMRQT